MKDYLAERLLAKVMGWEAQDLAAKRNKIQAMAQFKYDGYQQFRPRMRFIESLALWLKQFQASDREVAYRLVLEKLLYFSEAEINHFVSIAFRDFIRPILLQKAAKLIEGVTPFHVKQLHASKEYKLLRRKTLFLGLSDGARIDNFRRANPELSNEQIFLYYDLSKEKKDDLLKELRNDLKELGEKDVDDAKFETLCLLDDFSASGTSSIRKEGDKYNGKIWKVINRNFNIKSGGLLFNRDSSSVLIVIYISSDEATNNIKKRLETLPLGLPEIQFLTISSIPNHNKIEEKEILQLLKRYFDSSVVTSHWLKAKHENPWLGYNECGIPTILCHNTPNNSPPLLWFEECHSFRGLFPRVSRHK